MYVGADPGTETTPWVIVLVDQTTIDGVQVVNAAIPLEGRAVPVAWIDFEYPWKTLAPPSQNTIERYLLTWLAEAAPPHVRLLLVFDRGYARVRSEERRVGKECRSLSV